MLFNQYEYVSITPFKYDPLKGHVIKRIFHLLSFWYELLLKLILETYKYNSKLILETYIYNSKLILETYTMYIYSSLKTSLIKTFPKLASQNFISHDDAYKIL